MHTHCNGWAIAYIEHQLSRSVYKILQYSIPSNIFCGAVHFWEEKSRVWGSQKSNFLLPPGIRARKYAVYMFYYDYWDFSGDVQAQKTWRNLNCLLYALCSGVTGQTWVRRLGRIVKMSQSLSLSGKNVPLSQNLVLDTSFKIPPFSLSLEPRAFVLFSHLYYFPIRTTCQEIGEVVKQCSKNVRSFHFSHCNVASLRDLLSFEMGPNGELVFHDPVLKT